MGLGTESLVEHTFFLKLWKTLLSFSSAFKYFSEESVPLPSALCVTCHTNKNISERFRSLFISLIVLKFHDGIRSFHFHHGVHVFHARDRGSAVLRNAFFVLCLMVSSFTSVPNGPSSY